MYGIVGLLIFLIGTSTTADVPQSNAVEDSNDETTIPPCLIKNPLLSVGPIQPPIDTCPMQKSSLASNTSEPSIDASGHHDSQAGGGGPPSYTATNVIVPQPSTQMTPEPTLQPPVQASSELALQPPITPGPVSQPAGTEEKTKTWRPPSNKSARTLCMHRYRKQIGGSLEEFNSYFEALSAEAKARYRDEVKELVHGGVWTNGTADVIAKFSGLPMH